MLQNFCQRLLYQRLGWKKRVTIPVRRKCIICVAPHTSNMDFIMGLLFMHAEDMPSNFMMKKSWFVWPLGLLFRRLGGIPVNRSKHMRMTDAIANAAQGRDDFRLAITPEGTRSKVQRWKRGFYYIALKAQLPIQFYAIDFEKKEIVCTLEMIPQEGHEEEDMRTIMNYYKNFTGKHPEKFEIEHFDD